MAQRNSEQTTRFVVHTQQPTQRRKVEEAHVADCMEAGSIMTKGYSYGTKCIITGR